MVDSPLPFGGIPCNSILSFAMKEGENQRPLTNRASGNGQNCSPQQEIQDIALSIGKTSISKRQAVFRKSLHLGTIFSRGVISAIFCSLGVALPQAVHADTTTISTPTTTPQGPISPPLNGGDTLIITPQGSITVTGGLMSAPAVRGTYSNNTIDNNGSITLNTDGQPAIFIDDDSIGISSNSIINSGS
jgi:hypothetical protein